MLRIIFASVLVFSLSACNPNFKLPTLSKPSFGSPSPEVVDLDVPENATVGRNFRGMSNKTIRVISKRQLFEALCSKQSEQHNEQRLITSLAPPVVLVPNTITGSLEAVALPDSYQSKVYNQDTPPFDMVGCISQASSNSWERIANNLIGRFFDVAESAIPIAGGVAVADRLFDFVSNNTEQALENAAPSIEGDNNRVVVGDENVFNEAGGIPAEPLTFDEVQLGSVGPEEESVDPEAPELCDGLIRDLIPIEEGSIEDASGCFDTNGNGLVCSTGGSCEDI